MEVKIKFIPRLTAPSKTDKHYLHVSKGGLNECIHIGGGSCLPNCVGYAWGRWYELLSSRPRLCQGNAEMWYGYTCDGYKRSNFPALGAVICWKKGIVGNEADGAGHVAVVERILSNGDIVTSNSAYGGSRFYTKTYKKSEGYNFGSYKFQGFILPPVQVKNDTDAGTGKKPVSEKYKVGDIVKFTGKTQYAASMATTGTAAKPGKAKITAIATGTKHPYHIVHADDNGNVYGWVSASDIEGAASTINVGDIVQFKGGSVYISAEAAKAAATKGVSRCKVTIKHNSGKHPYHLISEDGKGVYGWVDSANVTK